MRRFFVLTACAMLALSGCGSTSETAHKAPTAAQSTGEDTPNRWCVDRLEYAASPKTVASWDTTTVEIRDTGKTYAGSATLSDGSKHRYECTVDSTGTPTTFGWLNEAGELSRQVGEHLRIACSTGTSFSDLESLYAYANTQDSTLKCEAQLIDSQPTGEESGAAIAAYGQVENIDRLYSICTDFDADSSTMTALSEAARKEITGALLLCPNHPKRSELEAAVAQSEEREQAIASGSLIDHDGRFLVGTEIQPGVWATNGQKITECYWEVSGPNGEIIDNAFVSVAPSITVTIGSDAMGFTTTGCGDWNKVG